MRRQRRKRLDSYISDEYLGAGRALRSSHPIFVYVEGYDDIAFWRGVLSEFEQKFSRKDIKFEISTPARDDRAKGKKVALTFRDRLGESLWLCLDADFDYLLGNSTFQSKDINSNPYIIHTKVYAIENLLCLPTSLGPIAAMATKNDRELFDFVHFSKEYSKAIYPLFLWYFYAAKSNQTDILTLSEFKNIAKLNYLNIESGGESTIRYISKQVQAKVRNLEQKFDSLSGAIEETDRYLRGRGVKPNETHLWIQGHFWQDNVAKIALLEVCNLLKHQVVSEIEASSQNQQSKRNDQSAYYNSLRDIEGVIVDNTLYKYSVHYEPISSKIQNILKKYGKDSNN